MKTTKEEFLTRLSESNTDFEVLADFCGWHHKLPVHCKTCDYSGNRLPRTIIKGAKCPKCNGKRRTRTLEQVQAMIAPNVEIVSGYENVMSKVHCRCKIDGHEWDALVYNLVQGHGCPKCKAVHISEALCLDSESFNAALSEVTQDIVCVGGYSQSHAKAYFMCLKCGREFETLAHNVLQGSGCPYCAKSKGEDAVRLYLEQNHILYQPQKKFEGLVGVGGGSLSYDFYLPTSKTLIEFQGRGHYEPVKFHNREGLNAEEQFDKQQEHDRRKREYATNNGYNLLEIPYWEMDNIGAIINKIVMEE